MELNVSYRYICHTFMQASPRFNDSTNNKWFGLYIEGFAEGNIKNAYINTSHSSNTYSGNCHVVQADFYFVNILIYQTLKKR